jgi:hypothetical protein
MKHLSTIKPAEVLMLLNKGNPRPTEVLKAIFFDLIAKHVLKIVEVENQAHINDKVRVLSYVEVGENFNNYQIQKHETYFIYPFIIDNDARILFRNLVKIGLERAKSKTFLIKSIVHNSLNPNFYKGYKLLGYFGIFSISDIGIKIKNEIEQEVIELEEKLPKLIESNLKEAFQILNKIGGNALLIKSVDFELISQFQAYKKVKTAFESTESSYLLWDGFNDYSSSFDSASAGFDGFGGGDFGGAGAEGDGCSGCSGCSGCGGGD